MFSMSPSHDGSCEVLSAVIICLLWIQAASAYQRHLHRLLNLVSVIAKVKCKPQCQARWRSCQQSRAVMCSRMVQIGRLHIKIGSFTWLPDQRALLFTIPRQLLPLTCQYSYHPSNMNAEIVVALCMLAALILIYLFCWKGFTPLMKMYAAATPILPANQDQDHQRCCCKVWKQVIAERWAASRFGRRRTSSRLPSLNDDQEDREPGLIDDNPNPQAGDYIMTATAIPPPPPLTPRRELNASFQVSFMPSQYHAKFSLISLGTPSSNSLQSAVIRNWNQNPVHEPWELPARQALLQAILDL